MLVKACTQQVLDICLGMQPLGATTIAQVSYSTPFTAAVEQDSFFGVQFHPERSGAAGRQLLKNFLEM